MKACVFSAHGGHYVGTTFDTQTDYVRNILGFIGITDMEFVYAEGLNMGEESKDAGLRAALNSIAGKVGCTAETLRKWLRRAERDQGLRAGLTTSDRERLKSPRTGTAGLVHHSDRDCQYLSIRYSEHLAEAGVESSVGSVGDSYDNVLAENIIGLFKTEVIRRRGPWRNIDAVEYATREWVDWFNHRRLLEPIGNIPPAEKEQTYYQQLEESAMAA